MQAFALVLAHAERMRAMPPAEEADKREASKEMTSGFEISGEYDPLRSW